MTLVVGITIAFATSASRDDKENSQIDYSNKSVETKDNGDQKIHEENYGNSKDTVKVLKLTEKEIQFDAVA